MKTKIFLIAIISTAALLRLPFLDKYPNGFSGDETSQGYTAYSILKTGKDEWGEFLPIFPRSFGDYKPPLYTYMIIPPIFIFGLNEVAVRFPSAIIGVLTIIILFSLTKELFKKDSLALMASFFLAISPWHFQFSRSALEANIVSFFLILGLWLFLKGIKQPGMLMFSFFSFGLSLYSYQSAKLFAPLLIIVLLLWAKKQIPAKNLLLSLLIFLVFLIPTFFSPGPRIFDVAIFNKNQLGALNDNRFACAQIINDSFCRIFYNKLIYWTETLLENYISYFSPVFFFTTERPSFSYLNLPGTPLLYLYQFPLILIGIYSLLNIKERARLIVFAWLILAPIPAAFTTGSGHVHRVVTFVPIFSILSAFGGYFVYTKIAPRLRPFYNSLLITIGILSLIFVLVAYLLVVTRNPADSLRYGYRETITYTESVKSKYDKIIFSKSQSEPQAFVAFYSKMDPKTYQESSKDFLRYEQEGKTYLDQLGNYNLGKYSFQDIEWSRDKKSPNTLMVGRPEEFPENVSGVKAVYTPGGKMVFKIVESEVKTND